MALAVSVIGIFRGGPEIALIVSLSMVVIVIVGSVIGMSLSFLLSGSGSIRRPHRHRWSRPLRMRRA
jgi:hypothetical protein